MLIHVNWPSNAGPSAAQIAGYSAFVLVSKDQAGAWKRTRTKAVIAG